MTRGKTFRADIDIDHGPGDRRGVTWWVGRFIISGEMITVRSLVGWIPERSAPRDTVGEVTVDKRVEVLLSVLHWRRHVTVRFTDTASPLYGVKLRLSRRTTAVDELRARGYAVTDRRTGP